MSIPRSAIELETVFLSILGESGSGKSYFLTAMIHELRRVLPTQFAISFADVDPVSNRILNRYESSVFFREDQHEIVPLGSLIEKTSDQYLARGDLYETINLGTQRIAYSHPFLFGLKLRPEHVKYADDREPGRMLCLYDNAGEHFRPGQDTCENAATRHVAHSQALLFVFDPTQHPAFVAEVASRDTTRGLRKDGFSNQVVILHEAAARIRKYSGLAQGDRHPHPLIVILTKADQWAPSLIGGDTSEPWMISPRVGLAALDTERIREQSDRLKALLSRVCPEIVSAAQDFAGHVTYIATSALGSHTECNSETGTVGIRPCNIRPNWVAVPILYALSRTIPGLIPALRRVRRSERESA